MPKAKAPAVPDTHVLKRLMEEYLEMLREAEKTVKKVLALNPQKEEFWDQLSEHAAEISMVEIRSKTIVEEIDELIDQLPEDWSTVWVTHSLTANSRSNLSLGRRFSQQA